MTERPIDELYRHWRAAESRGDEAAADDALTVLFQGLPPEAPQPGFTRATLTRMESRLEARRGATATVARERRPTERAARRAAAVLALLSAGTLALASAVVTVLPRIDLAVGVRVFHAVVAALGGWIAAGVTLWLRAAEWSALLGRLVTVPEVAWSLLGAALTAALSFYFLLRILSHERIPIHADLR